MKSVEIVLLGRIALNDGIYTSTQPRNKPAISLNDNIVFKSDHFNSSVSQKVKRGCKIRWTQKGTSLLGDSCNTSIDCTCFYDCLFKIELGW